MPSVDASRPLLDAQAGAASDWGSATIQGGALAELKAELRRGFAVDVGLGAFVDPDASFSKFISAEAQGEAHAEARLTGQAQLPLDIFNEAGAAIRLKIAAEAAAGVTLRLGLNIGAFLTLARKDTQIKGLPLRLLVILLRRRNRCRWRPARANGSGPTTTPTSSARCCADSGSNWRQWPPAICWTTSSSCGYGPYRGLYHVAI
jgi:hypothetical protein